VTNLDNVDLTACSEVSVAFLRGFYRVHF
jgi:hypothetical protein